MDTLYWNCAFLELRDLLIWLKDDFNDQMISSFPLALYMCRVDSLGPLYG